MFEADDDEEFKLTSSGSKLKDLFNSYETDQESCPLTYTAPTDPKLKIESNLSNKKPTNNSTVLIAIPVQAFKLLNSSFEDIGRLSFAIINNALTNEFHLLLYLTRDKIMALVNIKSNFQFLIQENNYGNFYDSANNYWSIHFLSCEEQMNFAQQVALARAASEPVLSVFHQDLNLMSGDGAEVGDHAEIEYSSWTLDGPTCSKCVENKVMLRFKVGKGKVNKIFEEAVIGMKVGTHRFLVCPSNLSHLRPNEMTSLSKNIAIKIVLIKVKSSRKTQENSVTDTTASFSTTRQDNAMELNPDVTEDVETLPIVSNIAFDANLNESNQIVDLSEVDQRGMPTRKSGPPVIADKSELLKRLSKYGQQMLPVPPTSRKKSINSEQEICKDNISNVHPSDNSSVAVQNISVGSHLSSSTSTNNQDNSDIIPATALKIPDNAKNFPLNASNTVINNQLDENYSNKLQIAPNSRLLSVAKSENLNNNNYSQDDLKTKTPSINDQPFLSQNFIEEQQRHNSDMRIELARIHFKLDLFADDLKKNNFAPNIESKTLLQNLQRIITENETLKSAIYSKDELICQNIKEIEQLKHENQLLQAEKDVLYKNKNTATEDEKIVDLENKNKSLIASLKKSEKNVDIKNEEIEVLSNKMASLSNQSKLEGESMIILKEANLALKSNLELVTHINNKLQSKLELFKLKTIEMKEMYENKIALNQINPNQVNVIVNLIFKKLLKNFKREESYAGEVVLSEVRRIIHHSALHFIENNIDKNNINHNMATLESPDETIYKQDEQIITSDSLLPKEILISEDLQREAIQSANNEGLSPGNSLNAENLTSNKNDYKGPSISLEEGLKSVSEFCDEQMMKSDSPLPKEIMISETANDDVLSSGNSFENSSSNKNDCKGPSINDVTQLEKGLTSVSEFCDEDGRVKNCDEGGGD